MAITFNGSTKVITFDTATSFTPKAIYDAAMDWMAQSGNMQYLAPMSGGGYVDLGGGAYTGRVYTLINGWKLQPSGYAANTVIAFSETLTNGQSNLLAPAVGGTVIVVFQTATNATVVTTGGSALTTDEHNKLMSISPSGLTTDEHNALMLVPKLKAILQIK